MTGVSQLPKPLKLGNASKPAENYAFKNHGAAHRHPCNGKGHISPKATAIPQASAKHRIPATDATNHPFLGKDQSPHLHPITVLSALHKLKNRQSVHHMTPCFLCSLHMSLGTTLTMLDPMPKANNKCIWGWDT